MSDVLLKPCPFCGESLEIRQSVNPYGRHRKESDCLLAAQAVVIPYQVERWNTRLPAPEAVAVRGTPAAKWREDGKPDPHGDYYNGERAKLCCGHLTDDEIANAVFLDPTIGNLTAAKERIRWLSRSLVAASTTPKEER